MNDLDFKVAVLIPMAAGVRIGVFEHAGRRGHAVGNKMFNQLYLALFGPELLAPSLATGCVDATG